MILLTIQIACCVLIADFLSGLVHWLEDSYGNEDIPLIGKYVTLDNNLHHQKPSYLTRFNWWYSSKLLVGISVVVGLMCWALGLFSWQLGLVLALGANANEIHKWTHRSRSRNGKFITWLQDKRLIQSQQDHAKHHRGEQRGHYCVITPHLNALFERLGLWEGAERLIEAVLGVKRRDPSLGPVPELVGVQEPGDRS